MDTRSLALVALGRALLDAEYTFTTITPETQRRVNARPENARARSLRDVFGWSRPFDDRLLPDALVDLLSDADALVVTAAGWKSAVRFSTLDGHIFVHSAYPTHGENDVFFGPDTVRFCALIDREKADATRVVDLGCGSGAGGIIAKKRARRVVLSDVNDDALRFAAINATLAAIDDVEIVKSDLLAAIDGPIDLILANPPYMKDGQKRTYRDGGGDYGEALSVRIVDEAVERLASGGKLVLYTGAAIVGGDDVFLRALRPHLMRADCIYRYAEIDPDVFGEELSQPGYERVERIAAVSLVVVKR